MRGYRSAINTIIFGDIIPIKYIYLFSKTFQYAHFSTVRPPCVRSYSYFYLKVGWERKYANDISWKAKFKSVSKIIKKGTKKNEIYMCLSSENTSKYLPIDAKHCDDDEIKEVYEKTKQKM